MSGKGVFAVERGLFDHPMFADEPFSEREAFLWLISEAAYKPRKKRVGAHVYELGRGQLVASVRFLAERWKWSKSRVSRFLRRLEAGQCVSKNGTVAGQSVYVLSICNYNKYQIIWLPENSPAGQSRDTGRDKLEYKDNYISSSDEEDIVKTPSRSDRSPRLPIKQAFEAYNRTAEILGLPRATKLTDARRRALSARLRECDGLEGWNDALVALAEQPFLHGENRRGWRADLDFLTQPKSFNRVVERSYAASEGEAH